MKTNGSGKGVWGTIQAELERHGIHLDDLAEGMKDDACRIVCIAPGVRETVDKVGRSLRDQVVMVRVDEATAADLDAWVESGAMKSRSEAAAVFIREGLELRARELDQLREALQGVEEARKRLRDKAREIFGEGDEKGEAGAAGQAGPAPEGTPG